MISTSVVTPVRLLLSSPPKVARANDALASPFDVQAGPSIPFVESNPFNNLTPQRFSSFAWESDIHNKMGLPVSPPIPIPNAYYEAAGGKDYEMGYSLMSGPDPTPVIVTFDELDREAMPKLHEPTDRFQMFEPPTNIPRTKSSLDTCSSKPRSQVGMLREVLSQRQDRKQAPRAEELTVYPFDSPDDGVVDLLTMSEHKRYKLAKGYVCRPTVDGGFEDSPDVSSSDEECMDSDDED